MLRKILIIIASTYIIMFGIRYIIEYSQNKNASSITKIINKSISIEEKPSFIDTFKTWFDDLEKSFVEENSPSIDKNYSNNKKQQQNQTFVLSGAAQVYKKTKMNTIKAENNTNNTNNIVDNTNVINDANFDKETSNIVHKPIDVLKKIKPFKISTLYKYNCASCHGKTGNGFHKDRKLIGPPLVGLEKEYIYSRLFDYQDNTIDNEDMNNAVEELSESDIENLAIEISKFKNNF